MMAGFHPAAGRAIGQDDCGAGCGNRNRHDDDDAHDDDDQVESDFSDWDRPYHETASDWYDRHARRRARRLAGISSGSSSSSSSSSSDDDDNCSVESGDDLEGNAGGDRDGRRRRTGGSKRRKEMERAARSASRPLSKWLASYPLVASRCCFSSVASPLPAAFQDAGSNGRGRAQFNGSTSSLSPRDQEVQKLRRIFQRTSRKTKEFQVKFVENNSSSDRTTVDGPYYQTSSALSLEQMTRINLEVAQAGSDDQRPVHSFLPQGTRISFIDAALARDPLSQYRSAPERSRKEEHATSSRFVLELNGPPRSGMTSILLAVAARYVASTSDIFLGNGHHDRSGFVAARDRAASSRERPRPLKRRKRDADHAATVTEPRVVVLDLEKGVHAAKLILSVREAVLRRWEETAAARQWKREQERLWKRDATGEAMTEECEDESRDTVEEQGQIDLAVTSCLGRIHVVQPRDFTYLSLVATIEVLRQSLDKERAQKNPADETKKRSDPQFSRSKENDKPTVINSKQQEAPTLILIDSLSTLDESTRFQESLPTTSGSNHRSSSNGLSDRNEFYRQLIRLREEHEINILGASRYVPSFNNRANDQGSSGAPRGKRGGNSIFDKMVSHRISLHHVAEGTREDRAGYEFVATLNATGNQEGANIFPYSVTAGGIAC